MRELWEGCRFWSEEKQQAHKDEWAIRVISCPRKTCRRVRRCIPPNGTRLNCPGLAAFPRPAEEIKVFPALFRAMMIQSIADDETEDREFIKAQDAWRDERDKGREKLAWERAEAAVNAKRRP